MNKKGIAVGGFGAERRESQRLICAISFCFFLFFFSNQVAYFWGQRPGWMASLFFLDFRVWKNTINSLCCVIVGALRQEEQNKTKKSSVPRSFLHVPSIAEGTDAGLRRSFVKSGLQSDVPFVGSQLFLAKFPLVLVGHFGAETRTVVLRMLLRL